MSQSWRRLWGSSPVVGSSRNRMRGLPTSAVATARRCFWPPESLPTQASAFSVSCEFFENCRRRARLAVKTGEKFDGFAHAQLLREARILQRNANPLAELARVVGPSVPENADFSGSGREQAFEDFDGSRLPCSVGAEKTEAFAGLDAQAEAADSFYLAVVGLAQVNALDRRWHHGILNQSRGSECEWLVTGIGASPLASRQRIAFSFFASAASGLEKSICDDSFAPTAFLPFT